MPRLGLALRPYDDGRVAFVLEAVEAWDFGLRVRSWGMKDNIFISYRRQDSAGFTGRLYDTLARYFGQDRVFMDITNIRGGEDFVQRLDDTLATAGVFVVVIGKTWLNVTNGDGQRRLDDPNDFVRREVETALARDISVLPVLMDGASMPREDDLPDTLKKLTRYNAVPLSHDRWTNDVIRFAKVLEFDVSVPDAKKRFNRLRNSTFFCLVSSVITAVTHAQLFGVDPFLGVIRPQGARKTVFCF